MRISAWWIAAAVVASCSEADVRSERKDDAPAKVAVVMRPRHPESAAMAPPTYPGGRALVFHVPQSAKLRVDYAGVSAEKPIGAHLAEFRLDTRRKELQKIPLDVAFVLDTTGSMADEIERLRQTLDVIH